MARALLSDVVSSDSPRLAGMRLGGRSPVPRAAFAYTESVKMKEIDPGRDRVRCFLHCRPSSWIAKKDRTRVEVRHVSVRTPLQVFA